MSKNNDDEIDWKRLKAGRLDEGEAHARLLSGGRPTARALVLTRPQTGASTRATISVADAMHRIEKHGQYRADSSFRVSTFHLAHSSISRRQKTHPNAGRNLARQTAIRFQDYLERAGEFEDRADSIEADDEGPITLGNIGATRKERQEFWLAVDAAERRADARIQCRIIAELPHWIGAEDRRKIVGKFGEIFAEKKLGWFAAAHLPDAHGDPRNFHLHLVYSDRPYSRDPIGREFVFSKKKDRSVQGPEWIRHLREQFAGIANDVCLWHAAEKDTSPERVFFPGRNIDIGLISQPGRHLGAKKSALLRRGANRWIGATSALPQRNEALGELIRKLSLYAKDIESLREMAVDGLHRETLTHLNLRPGQQQLQKAIFEAVKTVAATSLFLSELSITEPTTKRGEAANQQDDSLEGLLISLDPYFSATCSAVARVKMVYEKFSEQAAIADLHDLAHATIKELALTDPLFRQLLEEILQDEKTKSDTGNEKSQSAATSTTRPAADAKTIQPETKSSNARSPLDGLRALKTTKEAEAYLKSLNARDIEVLSRTFSVSLENERKLGASARPEFCDFLSSWLKLVSAEQKRRSASLSNKATSSQPDNNRTSSRRGHEL